MGSPSFGLLPGNNATPPPFFAGNNPTGGATGGGNNNFPNFPMFGSPSHGVVSPLANMPVFGSGMQGLSSGMSFPGWGNDPSGHLLNELGSAYGKGAGSYIDQLLMHGLFNPQVASAYLNAMQPGINRGEQDILSSFASEGSRFGSAAALGEGNFLSQANLNEQQTLASMYMQAQQEQLGLLENVIPTLHAEQANKGGFWTDLLGGLETAAGVATEVFAPGNPIGIGLIGSGVGELNKGVSGGNAPAPTIPGMSPMSGTPSFFPSNSGQGLPLAASNQNFWDTWSRQNLSGSGGTALGATNPSIGDPSGNSDLGEFLMMGGGQ